MENKVHSWLEKGVKGTDLNCVNGGSLETASVVLNDFVLYLF